MLLDCNQAPIKGALIGGLLASAHSLSAATLEGVTGMDLVVHMIDVGVGDAILIELPDREQEILIDAGDRRSGFNINDYLDLYVDSPIELAVITHPDYDHWSGFERILDSGDYSITELWDPGYGRDCKFTGEDANVKRSRDTYLKFINSISSNEVSQLVRPAAASPGEVTKILGEVEISILYASESPMGSECSYIVNNASIVLKIMYKDVVFLMTGDINGKERNQRSNVTPSHVEAELLTLNETHPDILKADVLKVPHHGSETANTSAFIDAVAPRFALISSSNTYHYLLPKKRVLQRYQRARFEGGKKIEKVLYTNFGETSFENRQFNDDHIICGTNGEKEDLICDYIWRFEGD